MIQSITMKNVATYDEQGVELKDLGKVNFIYGANASGKTTISNFLETPQDAKYAECIIKWRDDIPLTAYVYNRRFREKNFGEGQIPGVFTLGSATKEEIDNLKAKQELLKQKQEDITKRKNTIEKLNEQLGKVRSDFEDRAWTSIYKRYQNDFNEAFSGAKSKERFLNRLLDEFKNNHRVQPQYADLKKRSEIIFGTPPVMMQEIVPIQYEHILEIENDFIWSKIVVGKSDIDIASLIQKLGMNDWVNEGRRFITDDSDICPFCQKHTIDDAFKCQIEEYFDDTFTMDIATIEKLQTEYLELTQSILTHLQEMSEKEYPTQILEKGEFIQCLTTLRSLVTLNKDRMSGKKREPSRSVELSSTKAHFEIIGNLIGKANQEIKENNKIVEQFSKQKDDLISDIWTFLSEENKNDIDAYNKKYAGISRGIIKLRNEQQEAQKQYLDLDNEIKTENANITSIQPTIDEINKILTSYGFDNFKIVPVAETNYYQIQRHDGSIANATLSEGEVTFITFLYFCQLAKGGITTDEVSKNRVLIIDDPISSLDSTILFVVSSLIKEMIKNIKAGSSNIKQMILLTHNVYFHKEASFVDGRHTDNAENKHLYWILRRNCAITNAQYYGSQSPILNSYELLWQDLREKGSGKVSLITIQNTMRRIIENYFKIIGGYDDEQLLQKFDNKQEREICRSLLCWINDGSHCIPDSLFVEQPDILIDKYSNVFRKIFENMGHIAHYNMMMKIEV